MHTACFVFIHIHVANYCILVIFVNKANFAAQSEQLEDNQIC